MNSLCCRAARAALLLSAALLASCESPTGGQPGAPARMDVVAGDLQTDTVDTELPQPLVVRVLDERGRPLRGHVVNFVVTAGGGSVFAGAAQTNQDGEARERWTLGTVAGDTQRVEVRAVDAATGAAQVFATFRAVGVPDVAVSVARLNGRSYAGTSGMPMADSVAVKVVDRHGNGVPGVQVAWAARAGDGSFSPATSVTDASGVARSAWTPGAAGAAQATATVAGLAPAQLSALVNAGAPARVVASADSLSFTALRQTTRAVATAYDAYGNALSGQVVRWMSLDTAVVQVHTFDGWVTAWGPGTGRVVAYALEGDARDTIVVRVQSLAASLQIVPRQPYQPYYHTALGDSIRLYVNQARDANGYPVAVPTITWTSSDPSVAQVGPTGYFSPRTTGTFWARAAAGVARDSVLVMVRPGRPMADIQSGPGGICLIDPSGSASCAGWDPSIVVSEVAVGSNHSCMIVAGGTGYCYGQGDYGQLGDGRSAGPYNSVWGGGTVQGGLRFTSMAAGMHHSCGVADDGVVYCWGRGTWGQLGSGARDMELQPTPVTGSETLRFREVYAAENSTCAISTENALFCWGAAFGVAAPTPMQAPRAFSNVTMGGETICGVDVAGRGWCWQGAGAAQAVSGNHTFARIETAGEHVCGLTTAGQILCWGPNTLYQLGTGTASAREDTPQQPAELRYFVDVAVSPRYTCGLSRTRETMCWGGVPLHKSNASELWPTPL